MTTLKIIVASTRPGSSGPAIAGWIAGAARRGTEFDYVEVLDLAEINLPWSSSRPSTTPVSRHR